MLPDLLLDGLLIAELQHTYSSWFWLSGSIRTVGGSG
jgi:hypothetical protein